MTGRPAEANIIIIIIIIIVGLGGSSSQNFEAL